MPTMALVNSALKERLTLHPRMVVAKLPLKMFKTERTPKMIAKSRKKKSRANPLLNSNILDPMKSKDTSLLSGKRNLNYLVYFTEDSIPQKRQTVTSRPKESKASSKTKSLSLLLASDLRAKVTEVVVAAVEFTYTCILPCSQELSNVIRISAKLSSTNRIKKLSLKHRKLRKPSKNTNKVLTVFGFNCKTLSIPSWMPQWPKRQSSRVNKV
jgi:hypothetical protein